MHYPYTPRPIDTRNVELPNELQQLSEMLARNTHENYVHLRMQQGWSYGPVRDDQLKTNPTLIPYHQLSESEKEYDRLTSIETLKVIIALGYRITRVD